MLSHTNALVIYIHPLNLLLFPLHDELVIVCWLKYENGVAHIHAESAFTFTPQ